MTTTLYDTKFSLYCQLVRAVMYENRTDFKSHYVDLPNGEQLEPWFARTNPKMLIPSVKTADGAIINESRVIMARFDTNCPKSQQDNVERIMDIAFSCDLGWFSTVAMKKKIWLWRLMQDSGMMESTVRKTIKRYAKENKDLEQVYMTKLVQSEKDVNSQYNLDRGAPIQKCLDDMAQVLQERKKGEWVSGPKFTRADSTIAIYIQWAMWQTGWDKSLLTIDPILMKFYDEVKDRECIVKTLDVDIKWVGFYWRDRLVPVQRMVTVAALAIVAVAANKVL